ncbi:hypothetical protein TNCV_1951621 [Trichonephila clavipes]|nr:hypothetical protein TNCV_1951621 [Trichonephila clavipes]
MADLLPRNRRYQIQHRSEETPAKFPSWYAFAFVSARCSFCGLVYSWMNPYAMRRRLNSLRWRVGWMDLSQADAEMCLVVLFWDQYQSILCQKTCSGRPELQHLQKTVF